MNTPSAQVLPFAVALRGDAGRRAHAVMYAAAVHLGLSGARRRATKWAPFGAVETVVGASHVIGFESPARRAEIVVRHRGALVLQASVEPACVRVIKDGEWLDELCHGVCPLAAAPAPAKEKAG